jgi:hypothetical protein
MGGYVRPDIVMENPCKSPKSVRSVSFNFFQIRINTD